MGGILWTSMAVTRVNHWRLYGFGYTFLFCIALLSKVLASNVALHKASLGDSIWAILFGCMARNTLGFFYPTSALPPWLKVSQQTELYIATSLVLLCIDISVLRPLAPRALFVSWLDTPTLFMVVAMVGWRWLNIDRQTAIIMSGATFICGSSAAIALGASMGVPYKTEMPIAIISIFTIPSIIALPSIAKQLNLSATVSGAWFGGCVDSTGAVIASASIYGEKEAINTAAVVKMVQNVLIGPISVIVAWAWTHYELQSAYKEEQANRRNAREEEAREEDVSADTQTRAKTRPRERVHVLLWKRFPKFVLGFIITAVLFNTVLSTDPTTRQLVNDFCFYVSEWFSTLSFVSIGLGLQFNDMKQNMSHLGKLCTLYLTAQLIDIAVTGGLAYTAFTYL
ncbi:hypothetical protein BDF14DRAFT_1872950 [Spinellus fusiger]|nr:hypothetical protein BDF14DRAFT_1872950 [Spinellus fusiger]